MKFQIGLMRKKAGLRQSDVAALGGFNLRTYRSWETEEASISLKDACYLHKQFLISRISCAKMAILGDSAIMWRSVSGFFSCKP